MQKLIEKSKDHSWYFNKQPYEIRDNFEIVMTRVKHVPFSLEYASDRLKDNYSIVFAAVKFDGISIRDASKRMRENKNIVLEAVKVSPIAIEYTSRKLFGDREINLAAIVHSNGSILNNKNKKHYKYDLAMMTEAILQNGKVFAKLPAEFRENKELFRK
jgi:hypothetical protein